MLTGAADGLWLHGFGAAGEQLFRLDPRSGKTVAAITLGRRTSGVAGQVAAGDGVVAVRSRQELLLVDPVTNSVRATIPLPERPGSLAVGAGAVWLTDPAGGRLLRIDPGL